MLQAPAKDLSPRTEEQASALQQTAATMETLNATVRTNTDSAKPPVTVSVTITVYAFSENRAQ